MLRCCSRFQGFPEAAPQTRDVLVQNGLACVAGFGVLRLISLSCVIDHWTRRNEKSKQAPECIVWFRFLWIHVAGARGVNLASSKFVPPE
eukprot:4314539-Amphidinium_carterae.1